MEPVQVPFVHVSERRAVGDLHYQNLRDDEQLLGTLLHETTISKRGASGASVLNGQAQALYRLDFAGASVPASHKAG